MNTYILYMLCPFLAKEEEVIMMMSKSFFLISWSDFHAKIIVIMVIEGGKIANLRDYLMKSRHGIFSC